MSAPRILHLIDPATPGGGGCTLRFLSEAIAYVSEIDHEVIILGSRAHGALARRCGVAINGVVCPPLRQPILARNALIRAVRKREAERGSYDVVHAWTLPAAALAAAALPGRRRIATPTVGPPREASRESVISRVIASRHASSDALRPTPVFAASLGVAGACADAGVSRHNLRILPPAVNGTGPGVMSRSILRKRWGVATDAFVVAFVAEPASWADALLAVGVQIRLAASGRPMDVVVYHGAAHRGAAERWVRPTGYRDRMITDDAVAEPWRVLPGVDAVVVCTGKLPPDPTQAEAGILPLLQVMNAGVPAIAEATDSVRIAIPDESTGIVVGSRDVNAVCAGLVRLYDDRAEARRVGERGANHVRDTFGFGAYRKRLLEAYGIPSTL